MKTKGSAPCFLFLGDAPRLCAFASLRFIFGIGVGRTFCPSPAHRWPYDAPVSVDVAEVGAGHDDVAVLDEFLEDCREKAEAVQFGEGHPGEADLPVVARGAGVGAGFALERA